MDVAFSSIVIIIVVALVFDYINGFHDAANSIATVVSTRVLSPLQAVAWAAFFNFIAAFFFGTGVAKTVGAGMVDLAVVTYPVIFAGLMGAIIWNLITWYFGLPTSSSHALFGGYGGAAVAKAGFGAIIVGGWTKTLIFIVVAPVIGLVVGLADHDQHLLDLPGFDARACRPVVSPVPAVFRGGLQSDAWRQRCAEDDGDHHRRARRRQLPLHL